VVIVLARIFLLFASFQILPHAVSQLDILKQNLKGPESLELIGKGKHRVVYRIRNTDLLIKSPNTFYTLMPPFILFIPRIQSECIAYEISQQLNFGVVPFFQYVSSGSDEDLLISERCPALIGPLVLQSYIAPYDVALDVEHAHKVVIFNWITGRYDAKRENSIVDGRGRVWEVDNELLGAKLKKLVEFDEDGQESHWLLYEAQIEEPLSELLLDWILDLPNEIELNKTQLPAHFKEKTVLARESRLNMNLCLLKMAICHLRNQENPITFDLLKSAINAFPENL
jgi:hypothetical protein